MNRTLRALALILAAAPAAPLAAGELLVEGRVITAEPMREARWITERVGDCAPARPDATDLVALLAFDLRADCREVRRTEEITTGWDVVYEWNGRTHRRVMDEHPGETLGLRVRLD